MTYAQWSDPSPHRVRFITINPDVRLEVLDWGGTGQPMLFLAGLGNSAHIFDEFAPKFTNDFHVFGLTRRGFGASSQPATGYDVGTLASDILCILDSLKLKRVILVGHSFGGDEVTKFAATYPNRVEKLVYLDAAHDRREILKFFGNLPKFPTMTKTDSVSVSQVGHYMARVYGIYSPEAEVRAQFTFHEDGRLNRQITPDSITGLIFKGFEDPQYSKIKVPALAFYAIYDSLSQLFPFYTSLDSVDRKKAQLFYQEFKEWVSKQVDRFQREVVDRQAITMHGAHHYIFISHAAEVEKQMRTFLKSGTNGKK
jgi:pimeloyl-ACP methyl ester carboxylesterase